MDNITMKEIMEIATNYLQNPTDKEAERKLNTLKNQLVVREYLPMKRKRILLQSCVVYIIQTSNNSADFAYYKEMMRVFIMLFGYVANVDSDTMVEYINDTTYDVLQLSGILKYISEFCHNDFYNCVQMLDDLFKFEHLSQIMSALEAADTSRMDDLIKLFNEFKGDSLSPEVLQSLSKVLSFDDPTLAHIRDEYDSGLFKALEGENKK